MSESNEIVKALGQVPELVENSRRIINENEKKIMILADGLKKRMQAEIPSSEIEKITAATTAAVSRTRCASPDTEDVSRTVADNISKQIVASVKTITTEAVKEAIKDSPVKVEHQHVHTNLMYAYQSSDDTLRKWILGLGIYSLLVTLVGILGSYLYFNSALYIGAEYEDVYLSKYTTEAERAMLKSNTYSVSFVPTEFDKTPELVKQKIKRNKQILSQREMEDRANKGHFSTKVPLER